AVFLGQPAEARLFRGGDSTLGSQYSCVRTGELPGGCHPLQQFSHCVFVPYSLTHIRQFTTEGLTLTLAGQTSLRLLPDVRRALPSNQFALFRALLPRPCGLHEDVRALP